MVHYYLKCLDYSVAHCKKEIEDTLIKRIQLILTTKEKCSLKYVSKEFNKIVDALAKMILSNEEELHGD